jgi:TonB family protein
MSDPLDDDKTTPAQKRPRVGAVEEGELLAGRYRLVRFIASGGMGEVWEAQDQSLGEHVALKTIRVDAVGPDSLERFRSEVRLARRIAHRNVCRVFEFGEHLRPSGEKVSFLTMELLRGRPLDDVLRQRGRFSPTEALPVLEQLAAALDAAHREGIVHRDFKSPNVFLEEEPGGTRVVVTDFGLARALGSDVRLTQDPKQMMGTPGYMAPEQVMGRDAGPAADLWALGVVAFELVTGELPFTGETALAVALKRLSEPPRNARELVPDLPAAWQQALNRALARAPEHRFASAGQFVAALKGEANPNAPRSWRPVAVGAVGVVLLLADAAALWRHDPTPAAPVALPGPKEAATPPGLRLTPERKWAIDVPLGGAPAPTTADGGKSIGLVIVVARSGFVVGATGAILQGLPNEADGPMDFAALRQSMQAVKAKYPQETSLVVFCESGVERATCDLARVTAAERDGQPLFPDQWLVEGAVAPGLFALEGAGFEVNFAAESMMPVRRLTAEALGRLKAKYNLDPLLRPCDEHAAPSCDAKTHEAWCDEQERFVACCGQGLVAVGHDGLCACPPGGVEPGEQVPGCAVARGKQRELLARDVRAMSSTVQQCYEARLGQNAKLSGKIVVGFRLAPDGRVFDVRQVSAELADADVQFCVLQTIRAARFSPPPGGSAVVEFPFEFAPK